MRKKTAVSPKVEISRIIWSNIRKAQYLNCLSDEQLAGALNVTVRTLHNYDNNPDVMTLATVQIFTKNMSMPFEQLIII
jgi:hypothetical protein